MVEQRALIALLGELQAAIVSPDRWPVSLQTTCRTLDATSAFVALTDHEMSEVLFERSHPSGKVTCEELLTLAHVPPGRAVPTEGGDPPHGLVMRIEVPAEPARPFFCLGIHRAHPFSDHETLSKLGPLLQPIARCLVRLRRLEADNHCARAFLDHLKLGVLLADAEGGLQLANQSARAILDQQDGLSVRRGQLCPTDVDNKRPLREMLARVISSGTGGALTLTRSRGRQPLQLLFQPVNATGQRNLALVFLSDPDPDPDGGCDGDADLLCELYGLTSAEARVAQAVVHGIGIPAVARRLGVSVTTVRTHLQQVFTKTNVHRQPELTRLLLCGPLQLQLPQP